MKKVKLVSALVLGAVLLAGCGSKSSESSSGSDGNTTYKNVYLTDIASLDYTFSSRQTNSTHYANFVDGLTETDQYGTIKGALAKSWDVSSDGLTYTYHLRKGVKWVTSDGQVYGNVTAKDFVTGVQHAADAKSETLYIISGSIKGLADYASGKDKDFSKVGVKAVDDYTVQYTLNAPESYWNSKTLYGVLYPVNAEFLKSKGDKFGSTTPDSILYNGAFILSNNTAKSEIDYKKNENYWDKKDVHIDNVKYTYDDGSNPDNYFKQFQKGNLSLATVYPNSAGYAAVKKAYPNAINSTPTGTSTYNMTFNFNRKAYNATSKKTDAEKTSTQKAILNRNFRLAIEFGFDKKSYNAQKVGEDGAVAPLRNMLTMPTFVKVDGQDYSDVVSKDLKATDSAAWSDVNLSDGNNSQYNATKAKTYLEKAKSELSAQGVSFPIHLDLPVLETNEVSVNQMKSLKSTIEKSLGAENVVVDIQLLSQDKYNNATYQATSGAASDFDISTASGWGPDYQDPSTYLNIYNSKTGDMLQTLGLDGSESSENGAASASAVKAIGLDKYDALLETASKITDDTNKRYEAYAKAEAWLLDNAIQIPIYSDGGTPNVSKVQPFTKPYSLTGIADLKLKDIKLQDKAVTNKEYKAASKKWTEKREELAKEETK